MKQGCGFVYRPASCIVMSDLETFKNGFYKMSDFRFVISVGIVETTLSYDAAHGHCAMS